MLIQGAVAGTGVDDKATTAGQAAGLSRPVQPRERPVLKDALNFSPVG